MLSQQAVKAWVCWFMLWVWLASCLPAVWAAHGAAIGMFEGQNQVASHMSVSPDNPNLTPMACMGTLSVPEPGG